MAQPDDTLKFDPNRSVFTSPAARFTFLDHPLVGLLKINTDSKVIVPIDGKAYPQYPLKLPKELMDVPQPNVRTCGQFQTPDGNFGCQAAAGGGCPILQRYGRVGPVNVIAERNGKADSFPCYTYYVGMAASGRPTSQVHYQLDGYNILMDRTTIPENIRDPLTKREHVRQSEVPDLAPWYEENKVGRFATNGAEKKKRGRPRKAEIVS